MIDCLLIHLLCDTGLVFVLSGSVIKASELQSWGCLRNTLGQDIAEFK